MTVMMKSVKVRVRGEDEGESEGESRLRKGKKVVFRFVVVFEQW